MLIERDVQVQPDGRMDRVNAAIYIGGTAQTLANLASRGKGPRYIRRGRVWYFKADLDEWILNGDSSDQRPILGRLIKRQSQGR